MSLEPYLTPFAFQWAYPSYFPFFFSVALAVIGDFAARRRDHFNNRITLWTLNGCLIYATAVGGTEVTKAFPQKPEPAAIKAEAEQVENAMAADLSQNWGELSQLNVELSQLLKEL